MVHPINPTRANEIKESRDNRLLSLKNLSIKQNKYLADRTRGHALVVMLAYKIVQELANRWKDIELTVQEGINELSQVCAIEMRVNNQPFANRIPHPRASIKKLLKDARVRLPEIFPVSAKKVATRKKLVERRKKIK